MATSCFTPGEPCNSRPQWTVRPLGGRPAAEPQGRHAKRGRNVEHERRASASSPACVLAVFLPRWSVRADVVGPPGR